MGRVDTVVGSQLTTFALLCYVWSTTHSPALAGGIAVGQLVATVVAALVGGLLADRRDRRRLVLLTQAGSARRVAGAGGGGSRAG